MFGNALALACALFCVYAVAQEGDVTLKSTEVAPGLYMIEGVDGFFGGNLGLSVGEDGVVLIDDGMKPFSEKVRAAVAAITASPIDFLINTHLHGDHTGGNEAFSKDGAHIVAHHNVRRRLVENGVATGPDQTEPAPKGMLPVITFDSEIDFHLNGQRAHVFHPANAHTDGDAVIHFPDADVIHTGDVFFNGMYPYIDLGNGGTVDGYIAAQEKILSMAGPSTKIIPGHGPLATKADLRAAVEMLRDAKEKVAALMKKGHSAEEIVAAEPLADYHEKWSWQFISSDLMVETIVNDLK